MSEDLYLEPIAESTGARRHGSREAEKSRAGLREHDSFSIRSAETSVSGRAGFGGKLVSNREIVRRP
jgi:hypothetical protein